MKKVSHKRHLVKAISWRVIGTIDTIIISWIVTHEIGIGIKIGLIEVLTKIFIYYLHERVWYKYILFKKENSRLRHILKAISWRFIGSIDTAVIAWVSTGSFSFGLTIGSIEVVSKTILYYFHERMWYKSTFGFILSNSTLPEFKSTHQ